MKKLFVFFAFFAAFFMFVACDNNLKLTPGEDKVDSGDTGDKHDTSDTSDTADTPDTGDKPDTGDNPDTADTSDTVDTTPENDDSDVDSHDHVYVTCTPGETRECYEGPSGTMGIGACKSGITTCVEDGTDWSKCAGQVLPAPEICGNGIDENCDGEDMTPENAVDYDGDGYNYCTGDCCETGNEANCRGFSFPEKINPGIYEMADNYVDDNCNGEVDEKTSCDSGLSLAIGDYPGNAVKLAQAMGICEGLVSAEISLAGEPVTEQIDTNPNACSNGSCNYNPTARQSRAKPYYESDYQTFAVTNMFGTQMTPLEGNMLAVLSTGPWNSPTMNAQIATLDAGDMQTASKLPEDWINMMPGCEIPKAPSCGGQNPQDGLTNQCSGKEIPSVQDPIMLTLKMKVPSNARAFEFNLFFMSIEYPSTVCSDNNYNDFFIALLDSTYNEKNPTAEYRNPYDKNLAKDDFGNPVGVDLAPAGLFKACNPNCGGGGLIGGMTNSINKWGFCTGDELLNGTGFGTDGSQSGMEACASGHGGTGWLRVAGNVEPYETITLRLALWEQGEVAYGPDHSWDSTVVLDGFKWLPNPTKTGISPY